MLESSLETEFYKEARRIGARAIKIVPIQRGLPDRLVIMPGGMMYLVELKTETGHLSPIQKHWHETLKREQELDVHVLYGRRQMVEWFQWAINDAYRIQTLRLCARQHQKRGTA